ncbi:alkanesulfonate monooxygenase SsuD/methylene tetrahydromethanopterin reductase-like flavin-dependent oxidoreductase (luciferase family) [Actinocorallia herbida]|uniref:Alkanesulfonate monooxygenase SsuD/methylene tetrahydromethanopterin reductase-like flavin-dependent oxidoreductase (Luciferase family) n=1 Tax=Actinocorallia herbida TaxID=58109 RepID=A0A3N1CX32_9ACTN|nr:LLM class flavin-dependent oxidoreductase [Actinocorallia herbida]ROO85816.1 alkanesulfonate monooxygenase SsuD/methylene tetrahydromethanopterin reductase-like flavin-dependent oxidoreductase (luciferase family) [Actinocorallia herbida]
MKFGIMAPHQYPFEDDLRTRLRELTGLVEHAADLGYHSVWTINHFLSNLATPQPISMMARLIECSGEMRIGSGILLLPLFHPVHVAEEFATLDQLSGGRVSLGVAAGYREHEFQALGVDMDGRFRRLDEGVRLIKALWSGETLDFEGEFTTLKGARCGVPPLQKGGPPIYIGAGGKKAVRRAARLGDGWYAPGNSPNPRYLAEHTAVYDAALAEYGRTPVDRPIGVELYCAPTTERAVAEALPHARREYYSYAEYPALSWQRDRFDELVRHTLLLGSPELLIERIREYEALGFDHLIFRPMWLGMPVEDARRSLELFAREVMPAFA